MKDDITFKITRTIGSFSTSENGYTKELNLISWNGVEPKYDLRTWCPLRDKYGKGLTMNKDELIVLYELIKAELEG